MERTRWERVQSLFHRATELPEAEREAFLSLCGEKKTQERIAFTLKTGKPQRN